ncbi:MFS transporter [Bradyrhizobium manausense]|uniref:3-phenylpropionic acid transporter n=1 Tax=Bradyrhizobium manausense TaxID=989370 RepID=A0A0R3DPZ4_9BRAD|nr:MFS transporter [Bradyrhizobium manausense]KRQ10397.1 3-phenylpropionic acid transporter [Bradyrhizobium manausense]
MQSESQIPTPAAVKRRFAVSLALFYGTSYGVLGTHLPFFTVWLKAIGIEPGWIGIISAVPAVTRFTTLPVVTGLAERRRALRGAMILTASATALLFMLVGTQQQPLPVLVLYIVTCCCWTPLTPLTDAYALRGVARYKFDYGPVRLWGSVAFILGALACGLLIELIAARQLIWIIVAMATISALTGLSLQPLEEVPRTSGVAEGGRPLLRDAGFLAIIVSSALIQSSHVAYYTFASINWQSHGLGGLTIAGLWALGVCAEIVVFAVSPRFSLHPALLVVIGGLSAVMRWSITAHEPPIGLLAIAQLGHGLSFGLTQVGVMTLLVHHVPPRQMARAQGYYAATTGLLSSATSIISGAIYARYGEGLYYVMAGMAAAGALLIWSARNRLKDQPHRAASGG